MTKRQELSEAELQIARDFAAIWDMPQGRRVLEHIMDQMAGVDADLARSEPPQDPYSTFLAVGMRSVGIEIKRMIHRGFLPPEKPKVQKRKT